MDLRHATTARLRLDAVVPADLDEHHALLSDPGTWEHLPCGRHTWRERTAAGIGAPVRHWSADGLGSWSARLRGDVGDLPAGRFVGTGGCARREGTRWWNLSYRLTPAAWGHGLAGELVTATLDAARAVAPERPVVACLLEHDTASRRRAERAGPTLVRRGPDEGNPDPAAVRLVPAGRPLDDDLLAAVTVLA